MMLQLRKSISNTLSEKKVQSTLVDSGTVTFIIKSNQSAREFFSEVSDEDVMFDI